MRTTLVVLLLACGTACGSPSRPPAQAPPQQQHASAPPPPPTTPSPPPSAAPERADPACEQFWAHNDACWSDESHPKVRVGADQPRTCAMATPYLACADAPCGMPWAQCIVAREMGGARAAAPPVGGGTRGWFRVAAGGRDFVCFGYTDATAGPSAHCADVTGAERAAVDEVARGGGYIRRQSSADPTPSPLRMRPPPPPGWVSVYEH